MAPRNTLRLSALLVLYAFSAPLTAQAQQRDAAAQRTAYLDAKAAIVAKDWAKAQSILDELWAESPTYDVALGLGQAELNLAQYPRAAEHLGFALAHMPPRESPELRARAEEFMNLAKAHLGSVRVTVNPAGAEVLVDGQSVGRAPLGAEVPVEVGPHRISAREAGYDTVEVRVDALSGEVYPVLLQLSPATTPTPSPVAPLPPSETHPHAAEPTPPAGSKLSPPSRPIPASAYVAAGVAVAGVSVGIGTLIAASSKESDKDDILAGLPVSPACGKGTPYIAQCDRVKELDERASTLRVVGYVGFGVAAAAAGTATYLFVTRARVDPNRRAQSVRVLPAVGPGIVGAIASATF